MGRLIIDGNSVYEIDEECVKKGKLPPDCDTLEALKKQKDEEIRKEMSREDALYYNKNSYRMR